MQQYDVVEATIRIRRGDGWNVRPEAEYWDGRRLRFRAGWIMDEDDTEIYVGEWAMIAQDVDEDFNPGWIASGDLTDIVPVEREWS